MGATSVERMFKLTLLLDRVSKNAGIPMAAGKKFMRELALLAPEECDALFIESQLALVRELSAEVRKNKRSKR